jgi:hypothetical protein
VLAHARKLDDNLSAFVEGGLAALTIGRCLQRLGETELNEGISLVASGAIREATLKLSAVIQRPEDILSVLEDAAITLSMAMEPHLEAYNSSVQTSVSAVRDTRAFPSTQLFVSMKESQCPI